MAEEITTISTAIEFLAKIKEEKEVTLRFIKKDGTTRIMRCTLDFTRIPRLKQPKTVDLEKILKLLTKNKVLHVFDLEKNDWRSVPFEYVDWLETPNHVRFKIIPKK